MSTCVKLYHTKPTFLAVPLLLNDSPYTHLLLLLDYHAILLPQYSMPSIILIYKLAVLLASIMCKMFSNMLQFTIIHSLGNYNRLRFNI